MPTICYFFGILIQMYWRDHEPPHFHAVYADSTAIIDIETLKINFVEECLHVPLH